MTDFYTNRKKTEAYSSSTSSPVSLTGASAIQRGRCPSCGRDLSQPNLLPPSGSKSSAIANDISRGHGICGQCGGLGAGLLDGI
jgi:hypothetical protein